MDSPRVVPFPCHCVYVRDVVRDVCVCVCESVNDYYSLCPLCWLAFIFLPAHLHFHTLLHTKAQIVENRFPYVFGGYRNRNILLVVLPFGGHLHCTHNACMHACIMICPFVCACVLVYGWTAALYSKKRESKGSKAHLVFLISNGCHALPVLCTTRWA